MTKPASINKKPREQLSPEFRDEALKLAERIGVAAARQLSFQESQPYAWRSKKQQQTASSERENELAAEPAEELTVLPKAATYFVKRLKWSMSLSKNTGQSSVSTPCVMCFRLSAAAGRSGKTALWRAASDE